MKAAKQKKPRTEKCGYCRESIQYDDRIRDIADHLVEDCPEYARAEQEWLTAPWEKEEPEYK